MALGPPVQLQETYGVNLVKQQKKMTSFLKSAETVTATVTRADSSITELSTSQK